MNEVFFIFLSLSLSGSLVASFLYLLKPLYKDRLSKTWQYYVLLIVILRLLVPFSPEINLVGMIFNQAGSYADTENIPAANVSEINYTPEAPPTEIQLKPESNANSPDRLRDVGKMAIDLLWLVWLVPAFVLLVRKIIGYNRLVRSVKAGCKKIGDGHVLDVYREVCRTLRMKHFPTLARNESVAAPMLAGAIWPVIILPDKCLEDREMRYVFRHELTHYKRLDIVYKWLVQITFCLHWYNPFIYLICRDINRNCELSCDEAVIMRLDEIEKYAYGDMLLESIKLYKNSPPPVVSVMLHEDTKLIKERLAAIMKFRKITRISKIFSLAFTGFFLCGALYMGAYAQSNGVPTSSVSEINDIPINKIPDTIKYDNIPASSKLQFGPYELSAENTYSITVGWQDGSDTLKLFLTGVDGYQIEYTLSKGKSENVNVPKNGLYYFHSPRNRETGDMRTLSIKFNESDVLSPVTPIKALVTSQTVVYESVEMRRYEQSSGSIPAHPYIHDIKTNNTNKKITEHQRGMLAYDKNGKPLKIDWFSLDSELDCTFYFLYDWGSEEILPGNTDDVFGGWSLNINGNDTMVSEIAYVLYCDKEITFEDGTVWRNSDFDNWRKTYLGKTIDIKVLENYYPYVQKIIF